MGTITINVEDDVEKRFREIAGTVYNEKKGYLGKALTKAMLLWSEEEMKTAEVQATDLLNEGFEMGKKKFKTRDELHDR